MTVYSRAMTLNGPTSFVYSQIKTVNRPTKCVIQSQSIGIQRSVIKSDKSIYDAKTFVSVSLGMHDLEMTSSHNVSLMTSGGQLRL